jgi:hypothetical protein
MQFKQPAEVDAIISQIGERIGREAAIGVTAEAPQFERPHDHQLVCGFLEIDDGPGVTSSLKPVHGAGRRRRAGEQTQVAVPGPQPETVSAL